uniref:Shugoshin_C domain-containing protein n=1 Tax=Mesocestoides corti TaxID=53468 RepID=A0A5K3EQ62_MESCO
MFIVPFCSNEASYRRSYSPECHQHMILMSRREAGSFNSPVIQPWSQKLIPEIHVDEVCAWGLAELLYLLHQRYAERKSSC